MTATIDSNPPLDLYCPTCEVAFGGGELCPTDGTRLVRLGAAVDPFVGRDLDGRYTILEKLGAGGMGAVYRATQHSVGREVAVKVVNPSLTSDLVAVKRFLREAKLASRLAHPNIVSVLDFGQTHEGVFYLVMELIEGETLHKLVHREGRLEGARVVRIGLQICDALEGAHKLPIIHRDLKPANIMMLAAGRDLLKVVDFGLAKSLVAENASTTMTSAGALLGTPAFMPPEVANGGVCDERSDLYSLGCILYLLGSGRAPFVTDSVPEMIALHALEPAPPMSGISPALGLVIDRLLEKDPARRYPSAAALRAAIEEAHDTSRGFTATTSAQLAKANDDVLTSGDTAKTREGKTALFVGPPPPISLPPAPSTPAARVVHSQLAQRAATAPAAETMPEGLDSLRPRRRVSLFVGIFVGIASVLATVAIVIIAQRSSRPASTITAEPIESAGSRGESSDLGANANHHGESITPQPPSSGPAVAPPPQAVVPPQHAPPKADRQVPRPKVTVSPPAPVPAQVPLAVPADAGDKPPPF